MMAPSLPKRLALPMFILVLVALPKPGWSVLSNNEKEHLAVNTIIEMGDDVLRHLDLLASSESSTS